MFAAKKLTKKEAAVRQEFWSRRAWPCVVLGVDPGESAGATLVRPGYDGEPLIVWTRAVQTSTRDLERAIVDAALVAKDLELPLVAALEEWGSGGIRGIAQWLGLGAQVGHWKRAMQLAHDEGEPLASVWNRSRLVRVNVRTWRAAMIQETGALVDGEWRAFDSDGWKGAAERACQRLYPGVEPASSDAAESMLLALYASRCDAVGEVLPKRHLKKHGF